MSNAVLGQTHKSKQLATSMPGNESQPPEANEHNSHLLRSRLGLINSTKYDGSNPNRATVGSSGHATGVP